MTERCHPTCKIYASTIPKLHPIEHSLTSSSNSKKVQLTKN